MYPMITTINTMLHLYGAHLGILVTSEGQRRQKIETLMLCMTIRPRPIMLNFLPIMLLSSAQKYNPLCSILCS